MHDAVIDFLRTVILNHGLDRPHIRVLDIGGRRVSSAMFYKGPQPYELFTDHACYLVLDLISGNDVDIVADATDPSDIFERRPWLQNSFDVVVCTEVLEHVEKWWKILETAFVTLKPEGRLLLTCAGPGRPQHAGFNELDPPGDDEHYGNVSHPEVRETLELIGFKDVLTYQVGQDTQATAVK